MNFRLSLTALAIALAAFIPGGKPALAGSLLVADSSTGNILQFDSTTGLPLASGPLIAAGSGGLTSPTSMALGPDGNLYIANAANSSVLEFSLQGTTLGTFVTSGAGGLQGPTSLVFGPDGNLLRGKQW